MRVRWRRGGMLRGDHGKKWWSTHSTASVASGRNSLGPHPAVAPPCCLASRCRTASVTLLHVVMEREREARQELGCPARRWSPARRPLDQERTSASRSGENERRERDREPPEREKESCFEDRTWHCATRKHTIVCHFWTLVIGRRREVRIGLFLVVVILGSRYKKCYFL
jgi:hypothetical protein